MLREGCACGPTPQSIISGAGGHPQKAAGGGGRDAGSGGGEKRGQEYWHCVKQAPWGWGQQLP